MADDTMCEDTGAVWHLCQLIIEGRVRLEHDDGKLFLGYAHIHIFKCQVHRGVSLFQWHPYGCHNQTTPTHCKSYLSPLLSAKHQIRPLFF